MLIYAAASPGTRLVCSLRGHPSLRVYVAGLVKRPCTKLGFFSLPFLYHQMDTGARARARDIVDAHVTSVRAFQAHLTGLQDFQPRVGDIFIVTAKKSGTTLLQQILYQLLVSTGRVATDPNGDAFEDISEVVPHVDLRHFTGLDKSIHEYSPRVWKSHCESIQLPFGPEAGVRVIYCFREGMEVIRSYADFTVDWLAGEADVNDEEVRCEVYRELFMRCYLGLEEGTNGTRRRVEPCHNWFEHVAGWLESPHEVLYVHYDDLVHDLPGWTRRLAQFAGLHDVGDHDVEYVVRRCDRATMAKDSRFRDLLVSRIMGWDERLGKRVREKGEAGFAQVMLPAECKEEYARRFAEVFGEGGWGNVVARAEQRNALAGF